MPIRNNFHLSILRSKTHPFNFAKQNTSSQLKKGFSLIDILLASFLLMVFLSILLIGSGSFLTTRRYSLQSVAAQITSDRIDYLRNQAKTNWAAFNSTPSPQTFNSTQIPELSKLPQGSQLIQNITNYSTYTDVKLSTITVNWTENSNTRTTKFETLIYRYGIN